jgi:SAM-dependent methyltransferase
MSTMSTPNANPQTDDYRQWKGWTPEKFGSCGGMEASYFRAELRGLRPDKLGTRCRVMEAGFGNGGFAAYCRDRGWSWVGTEVDPELVARARAGGFIAELADEQSSVARDHGPFQLIAAWDVVEHMNRSQAKCFVADCYVALEPGAELIFRVPAGDSPFSRAIQHTDPTHAQILTSHAARFLCRQAGFRRVTTRNTLLPIFVPSLSSITKRAMVRSIDGLVHPILRLLMRDPGAVLTPNMIVVAQK